jgi:hypothetical protein
MSANFVEELVAEYYRIKGYMIAPNYWFPVETTRYRTQRGMQQEYTARSWSDIDVLAIGEKEILLIQIKCIVNENKTVKKIETFFENAMAFIESGLAPDNESSIQWWRKGKKIRKILVYEFSSTPSYIELLKGSGIETYLFGDYFDGLVEYVENRSGFKEENALLRMIHFLNYNGYLNIETDQK